MNAMEHAQAAVALIFGDPASRDVAVRFWNGKEDRGGPGASSVSTIHLTSPSSLRAMCLPASELSMAEAFITGAVEVDGALDPIFPLARAVRERLARPAVWPRLLRHLLALPAPFDREAGPAGLSAPSWRWRPHTRRRDAQAVRAHYDLGNAFYALWLDRAMVYSCAYFPPGTDDLDGAQTAKLELLCRKLRLGPGKRLLDIGCGWGALVRHAARHHGVEAHGITLSEEQARWATAAIRRAGLADRCTVDVIDYRDLGARLGSSAPFDRIVSVGMIEHVGRRQLGRYFTEVYAMLAPGGIFVNHGIVAGAGYHPRSLGERMAARLWRTGAFIDRHVFPDGELPTLTDVVHHAEAAGFETRDVESLREHYVRTLTHWGRRLEAAESVAVALVGRARYRTWRLYLAASADAFARGHIGLAQTVLTRLDREGRTAVPATRDALLEAPLTRPVVVAR